MYEVTFSSAGFNSELIHKTRKVSSLNITKKTKETNENCLGSQIQSNEIRIGDRQELTQCGISMTTHMLKMMMVDKIHKTHDCNADDNRSDDNANGGDNTQ